MNRRNFFRTLPTALAAIAVAPFLEPPPSRAEAIDNALREAMVEARPDLLRIETGDGTIFAPLMQVIGYKDEYIKEMSRPPGAWSGYSLAKREDG